MNINLIVVGRLGRGPEAQLAQDYAQRASAAGKALGLGPVEVIEVEDVARAGDLSPYEVLTGLRGRLRRVYLDAAPEPGVPARATAEAAS